MQTVSKAQFKARALEFFRKVEETKEPLIVTDRGRPVIEINAYQEKVPSALQKLRGTVIRFDDPTEPVEAQHWNVLHDRS